MSEAWEQALAEQLVSTGPHRSPVNVEDLMVFLDRAGAFDQVGNIAAPVKEAE